VPNGGATLSLQNLQVQISSKVAQGKCIGPTCGFVASPEVGPRVTVGTLQTRYPCVQDLKDHPHDSRSVFGARGLWLHHMPRRIEHATHQKRAPVSPRAPWHRAHHPSGKGSGVATCPKAPCAPLIRKGLQSRHVPRGSRPAPCVGRLWRHLITEAPGPPLGRSLVSPRVLWLQTRLLVREGSGATMCLVALGPQACPCVPKTPDIRPIMTS
jgi:hypothetical protein